MAGKREEFEFDDEAPARERLPDVKKDSDEALTWIMLIGLLVLTCLGGYVYQTYSKDRKEALKTVSQREVDDYNDGLPVANPMAAKKVVDSTWRAGIGMALAIASAAGAAFFDNRRRRAARLRLKAARDR